MDELAWESSVGRASSVGRDWVAGYGEERTLNMEPMSVTLEVSKLSGWLKAAAPCRVQRRHPIREDTHGAEMAQQGKGESAAHAACVCGPARE
eukprot:scaffold16014_cov62-Phaeocystis_antarctica.AAC.4